MPEPDFPFGPTPAAHDDSPDSTLFWGSERLQRLMHAVLDACRLMHVVGIDALLCDTEHGTPALHLRVVMPLADANALCVQLRASIIINTRDRLLETLAFDIEQVQKLQEVETVHVVADEWWDTDATTAVMLCGQRIETDACDGAIIDPPWPAADFTSVEFAARADCPKCRAAIAAAKERERALAASPVDVEALKP